MYVCVRLVCLVFVCVCANVIEWVHAWVHVSGFYVGERLHLRICMHYLTPISWIVTFPIGIPFLHASYTPYRKGTVGKRLFQGTPRCLQFIDYTEPEWKRTLTVRFEILTRAILRVETSIIDLMIFSWVRAEKWRTVFTHTTISVTLHICSMIWR